MNNLPIGYTLCEYIESNGTQWIDTGIVGKSGVKSVIDMALMKGGASIPLGCYSPQRCYLVSFNNDSSLRYGYVDWITSQFIPTIGERYVIETDFSIGNQLLRVDDKTIASSSIGTSLSNNHTIYAFAYNDGGKPGDYSSLRLYSLKLYDNGILVRDYIPCMNANNVYGLYDKVNGVLYASATDSGFTGKWAENKTLNVSMSEYRHRMLNLIPKTGLPKGYFRCEYIESDGTNFIDTGFKPNNNTRVTCDFEFMTTPSKTEAIFGARTSASSKNYAFLYASSTGKLRSDYNKSYNQEFDYITGRFQIDKNKETTTISGESKSYTNASFSSSYNLYLFALNQADTAQWYATARIYSCQIYDNGVKVRDYVPCVSPDGYFGLYDLVTGEFCGFVKSEPSRSYTVNRTVRGLWSAGGFANPDSSRYDAYRSELSNGVDYGYDIMRITIKGYDEFTCYIRSYAESSYDYTIIGNLDVELGGEMGAGSIGVKAHTQGNQNGGTDINSYTKVVYTGIGGGTHFIDVMYLKDGSVNANDDRGYLLIDKSTVSSGGTIQVIGHGRVILPSGYINAEYIEGDGNAWVDSGYFPNGNTKVVMDAQMNSYSNGFPAFFGVFGSSNRNSFSFLDPASESDYYAYYYGSSNTASNKITAGMFDRGLIIADKGTANYHGTIVSLADASFTSTNTLYLFCGNENGTLKYNASMRLYQCQIHDNGTFTKFFVPCSKDGVFGLYEMVGGVFYTSEGSSDFSGSIEGEGPSQDVTLPDYSSYRGVYIEDTYGYLYTQEEWHSGLTPNGIAVLTDNCRFVMALQDVSADTVVWAAEPALVEGITTTTLESEALADYDGKEQTGIIVSTMPEGFSAAADACSLFRFPNGKTGYMGAVGEWRAVTDNNEAVRSALAACGGGLSSYYWTSTQYSANTVWYIYTPDGGLYLDSKEFGRYVRAFTTLKSDDRTPDGGGNAEQLPYARFLDSNGVLYKYEDYGNISGSVIGVVLFCEEFDNPRLYSRVLGEAVLVSETDSNYSNYNKSHGTADEARSDYNGYGNTVCITNWADAQGKTPSTSSAYYNALNYGVFHTLYTSGFLKYEPYLPAMGEMVMLNRCRSLLEPFFTKIEDGVTYRMYDELEAYWTSTMEYFNHGAYESWGDWWRYRISNDQATTIDFYQNPATYSRFISCGQVNTDNVTEYATLLISFTVQGTACIAEKGMTWYDWCNSSYNDMALECIGYYQNVVRNGMYLYNESGEPVQGVHVISENGNFYLE